MAISLRATLDTLRSVAFGSITNAFLPLGTPLGHQTRIIHFINDTNTGAFISTDGANNMLYVPPGSFILYDLTTNRESGATTFVFAVGTQFFIKYSSAPASGSFYIACVYGDGE